MTIYEEALRAHKKWQGKISVEPKLVVQSKEDLSLAYTPGVAQPCLEIKKNPTTVYDYTWKGNTVAVVSDGTAVLGLGDIGPEAAMPVMEGKSLLFKAFAGINAVPICLDTTDPEEIIETVKRIAPGFGGINLEDISAPRCVHIERKLIEELNIPVFHDDQHGTAITVSAALLNALKIVDKKLADIKIVMTGTGAAGSAIIKLLTQLGAKHIIAYNIKGAIHKEATFELDFLEKEIAEQTNPSGFSGTLEEAMLDADVFIGVSAPGLVTKEMVQTMAAKSILFALANPEPEIHYQDAIDAGAYVVGTGRSDYPNQINNVLAFPGLFKGALEGHAKQITESMKLAAVYAIAELVTEEERQQRIVIPSAFNEQVVSAVAKQVIQAIDDANKIK